jgi:hypothetical protein
MGANGRQVVGEELDGVPLPWALEIHGLAFAVPLDADTRSRLALVAAEPDEDADPADGIEHWTNADGTVELSTCDGLVGLLAFRESVLLDGAELIGATRADVDRRLGEPIGHDEVVDSISYRDGPWELEIGFDETDAVEWVMLVNDEAWNET